MKTLLALITLLMAWESNAITCMSPDPDPDVAVREAWTRATAVVLATAEAVENVSHSSNKPDVKRDREITRFTVIKRWKGEVPESFETQIVTRSLTRGMRFNEGHTYLLYLDRPEGRDHYSTSICNRNLLESYADADMVRLDRIVGNQ